MCKQKKRSLLLAKLAKAQVEQRFIRTRSYLDKEGIEKRIKELEVERKKLKKELTELNEKISDEALLCAFENMCCNLSCAAGDKKYRFLEKEKNKLFNEILKRMKGGSINGYKDKI